MSREPSNNLDHLPPWLRELPLPPRPEDVSDSLMVPDVSSHGVEGTQGTDESAAMPTWLQDMDAPNTPVAPQPTEMPSWLQGMGGDSSLSSEPQSFPDWLRDSEPQQQTASSSSIPDWLRESVPPPPPEEPTLAPDWLEEKNRFSQTGDAPPLERWVRDDAALPADDSSATLPAWLTGLPTPDESRPSVGPMGDAPLQFNEATTPSLREGDSLPGWLQGSEVGQESADVSGSVPGQQADTLAHHPAASVPLGGAGRAADEPIDSFEVPVWLQDIPDDEIRHIMEHGEEESTIEPFSFDDGSGVSPGVVGQVPKWLVDMPGGESGTEVSSWFEESPQAQSLAPSSVGAPIEALVDPQRVEESSQRSGGLPSDGFVPGYESEALPPWLQDVGAPPLSQGLAAEGLPAWLRDDTARVSSPDDVPEWLQAGPSSEPAKESRLGSQGEVPGWLQSSGAPQATQGEGTTLPEVPVAPSIELPSVMGEDRSAVSEGKVSSDSVDDLPVWLRGESDSPAMADIPDWLQVSSTPPAKSAPVEQAPAASAGADMPDWLQPSQASVPEQPAPVTGAVPGPRANDLPPWLQDDGGQRLSLAGESSDANLPEWLRDTSAESFSSSSVVPKTPEVARPSDGTMAGSSKPVDMNWFGDADGSSEQTPTAGEDEFFGSTELPAWLRPSEPEATPQLNAADTRSMDWLTRIGAMEEESSSTAILTPKLPLPQPPVRTQSQREALVLLERLVAEPFPQPLPSPIAQPISVWQRIGIDRVLYGVLVFALLVVLVLPRLPDVFQSPPQVPGATDIFEQLSSLTDEDIVLVGYEWDARRIGELRPLEEAVIGQLMRKHVKLVLVSTDPQGTLLLFDLRDQLVASGYDKGGSDYVLLGYQPGGELALRSLAQDFLGALRSDFQGNDATQGALVTDIKTNKPRLTTLKDFSTILVLADDASDVQGWMEQIHRSAPDVPLGFLLPAEAAPIVQPYLKQPGILHLAGKQGALAYQALLGADGVGAEVVGRESAQQRLGVLLFVVLLLLGTFASGLTSIAARRRKVS